MPSSMLVRALGLATLALFFLGAFTPLPVFLYEMISVPVHIERADAIVVLAGGGVLASGQLTDTSLRRTTRGIALYRDGLAPLLVLSGAAGRRARRAGWEVRSPGHGDPRQLRRPHHARGGRRAPAAPASARRQAPDPRHGWRAHAPRDGTGSRRRVRRRRRSGVRGGSADPAGAAPAAAARRAPRGRGAGLLPHRGLP